MVITLHRSYYIGILVIYNVSDTIQIKRQEDKFNVLPVEFDTTIITKVRLSEFDHSDSKLWFAQTEHSSTRHNIKSEGIRYRGVCSLLPPSVSK